MKSIDDVWKTKILSMQSRNRKRNGSKRFASDRTSVCKEMQSTQFGRMSARDMQQAKWLAEEESQYDMYRGGSANNDEPPPPTTTPNATTGTTTTTSTTATTYATTITTSC